MKKLMFIYLFLLISTNLVFAQSQYVDDSWIHGNGKVTLTKPTDNVGIGSLNPGSKLDVQGSVRIITSSGLSLDIEGTLSNSYFAGNVGVGTFVPGSLFSVGTLHNGSSSTKNSFNIDQNGNVTNLGGGTLNFNAAGLNGSNSGAPYTFGNSSSTALSWVNIYTGSTTGYICMNPSTPSTSSCSDIFNSNGNVGIGTNNTSNATLTVNGNIQANGISFGTGTQPNIIGSNGIRLNPSGSQDLMTLTASNNFGIGSYLPQGGNVGIGSLNPGVLLDVGSSVRTGIGSQTQAGLIVGSDNTTGLFNCVDSTHCLGITSNGSEMVRFLNGNVGIGSPNPGTTLDVNGTARFGGVTLGGVTNTSWPSSGSGTVNSGTAGQVTFYASSTTAVSGTNAIFITGTGNVGVNSLTPGQKLDVVGTVRMTGFQMNSGSSLNGKVLTSDGSGNGAWSSPGSGTVNSGTAGNAAFYSATGTAVNGTSSLFFNGSGNVGVNSINPGQTLDINGTVRTGGFTMNQGSSLNGKALVSDGSGNGTWQNVSGSGTVNTGILNQFAFYSATGTAVSGTTNLIQNSNGNVGVGSANPGTNLDVNGTIRGFNISSTSLSSTSANFGSGFSVSSGGVIGGISNDANSSLSNSILNFHSGGGQAVIENNSTTSGTILLIKASAATNATLTLKTTSGVGSGDYIDFVGGNNGATDIMRMLGTGNVGIGSPTPGQALDVQGTIRGISAGACTFLYKCVGGVDAGVIQTSSCNLCPGGSCTQMNGCF